MTWAWLTEPPALLVCFIAAVIAIVQFVWPVVDKLTRRHGGMPAVELAILPAELDATSRRLARALARDCEHRRKGSEPLAPPGVYRAAYKRLIEDRARQDPTA